MDERLRRSQRDDDPLRRGVLLRRAGRVGEALDQFEHVWGEGDPRGGELALQVILSRPDAEQIHHAARLDRLARQGFEPAGTLLETLFPAVQTIVGSSQAMQALRSFIYQHAASDRPVVLWGESGVGHALAARTLHALSGREGFHEGYGPRSHRLFVRELAEHPPQGGTLYVSYAHEGQGWEEFVLETCRVRDLRLVIGAVTQIEPRGLLSGYEPVLQGIPPLRERFEDLPELLVDLLGRAGAHRAAERLLPEDVRRMRWHDWPGNVRELANHISRAVRSAHSEEEVPDLLFQGLFGLPGEVAEQIA